MNPRIAERSRALYFADYLRNAESARHDSKKAERQARRECKYCFYVARAIAGQGFTEYQCIECKESHMHANTSVPRLCERCADAFEACVRCGGAREWSS